MSFFDDASAGLTEAFTYTRSTRTAGSDGRAATPSDATASGNGVFEPLSGRELLRMPEGERGSEWLAVWTSAAITLGDQISYGGASYEASHADGWTFHGGYVRAQIKKIES